MINKTKGIKMTDKKWIRTLSEAKLAAMVGQSPMGALVEAEIKRRAQKRTRKAKILAPAA